jgi:hypothetical protein
MLNTPLCPLSSQDLPKKCAETSWTRVMVLRQLNVELAQELDCFSHSLSQPVVPRRAISADSCGPETHQSGVNHGNSLGLPSTPL